jgi:WS/DGAT/MGAT family acyltransferase
LQWVRDPEFDLHYHLRHIKLPDGSTQQDLLDWARTEAMGGFDPARPLWEFTLTEGLEGGKAALVMKAHHVVTDGIGAVQLAAHLFDFELDPPRKEPSPLGPVSKTSDADLLREVVAHDVSGAVEFTRHQLSSALPNLLHAVRHPQSTAAEAIETVRSIWRIIAPATTPKSKVMVGRMRSSNYRLVEVPVSKLHKASKLADGKLNDGFLAGITAGLYKYHAFHGGRVEELRVAMPISQRAEGDREGGNHVTVMRFTVPVHVDSPAERVQAMHAVVDRIRHERSLDHTEAIAGFLNLMPTGVIGAMLKGVDFLASNVPGIPAPMWLLGKKVERFYPFGPTVGSAMNLTLMSYNGVCCIGLNADAAAIPDPDVLADCLRAGFDEVCSIAPSTASTPPRTRGRHR